MNKDNKYIKGLIEKMSLEQKIGALLTLGFAGRVPQSHIYEYITKYHCGGLRMSTNMRIFGSYVDPENKKTVVKVAKKLGAKYSPTPVCTASEFKAVIDELQSVARKRPLSLFKRA